jgi:hypothetical protein
MRLLMSSLIKYNNQAKIPGINRLLVNKSEEYVIPRIKDQIYESIKDYWPDFLSYRITSKSDNEIKEYFDREFTRIKETGYYLNDSTMSFDFNIENDFRDLVGLREYHDVLELIDVSFGYSRTYNNRKSNFVNMCFLHKAGDKQFSVKIECSIASSINLSNDPSTNSNLIMFPHTSHMMVFPIDTKTISFTLSAPKSSE